MNDNHRPAHEHRSYLSTADLSFLVQFYLNCRDATGAGNRRSFYEAYGKAENALHQDGPRTDIIRAEQTRLTAERAMLAQADCEGQGSLI